MTTKNPLQLAIDAAGSLTALADALGFSTQRVNNWNARGIPPAVCPEIEKVTGIKCEVLLPEVQWHRNKRGQVTGYTEPARHVPLQSAA